MHATRYRRKFKQVVVPLGLAGLMAAALIAGSGISATADARPSPDRTVAQAQAALAAGKADKAIKLAEAVVAAAPREAAYRALLGQAYLKAGRFESAAQALAAAMTLGDNNARTALALALAQVGAGQSQDAVAVLDDWRDAIGPVDLGLALALAGETGRGVAILADAVRSGENSPKARQNLAYAYALDGRWREARMMAAQDVPANLIDDRIGEWAARARPEDGRARVAALLAAPLRADAGQPAALAMADEPGAADSLPQGLGVGTGTMANQSAELPTSNELPAVTVAAAEPAADLIPYRSVTTAFVARPVVQPVALRSVPAGRAANHVAPPAKRAAAAPRQTTKPVRAGGTHLVQLGSFASPQEAQRASSRFRARTPQLKAYRMAITPAVVRGKHFWRVTATGLDVAKANGLCASLKAQGGACLAYAARPSALPVGRSGAALLAKAQPLGRGKSGAVNQAGNRAGVAGPANARRHR